VNGIREKSFPEIEGAIWIIKVPFFIPGAMVFWLLPRVNLLILSTKCDKLRDYVTRGMIAHELSHFSIFQRKKCVDFWKFFFSSEEGGARRNERKTDRLAIRKGYGNELIAVKKEAMEILRGTRWEKMLDNYLTVEETRAYMKRVA
tara:strand:+ start:895 stop:1332 length:438 start_codon:yes stop_codon:yes gene_type:complete